MGVFPHDHVSLNKLTRGKKKAFASQQSNTTVITVHMIQTHTAYVTSCSGHKLSIIVGQFFSEGHLLGHIFVVVMVGYHHSLKHQTLGCSPAQEPN